MVISEPPETPTSDTSAFAVGSPQMGGVIGGDPFTGGAPNLEWTKLASPSPKPYSILCLRPVNNKSALAAQIHMTKPPTTLYAKGDDIVDYAEERARFFKKTGLDTIMYLPSEADKTQMVNVLEDYGQVTLDHVIEQSAVYKTLWDEFDIQNDRLAIEVLEASIDKELARNVRTRKEPSDTAAILWMRILALCNDGSIEKYNRMKDQIKVLSPTKEAGEDVITYSTKVRKLCHALVIGKQFEFVLIIPIVRALCSVSVESFRSYFLQVRNKLDKALKEIAFATKEVGLKRMRELKLDHTSILDEAESQYKSLLDNEEWDPAKMVKDLDKAPSAFLANMTEAQFNTLVQNLVNGQGNTRTCFTCGKPGHIANDCPQKGTAPTVPNTAAPGTQAPRTVGWRDTAPAANEPTTKVHKGKTFHFCSKCNRNKGRWTQSHTDATHGQNVPATPNKPATAPSTAGAPAPSIEPTAEHAKLASSETHDLLWGP
jgi:Zinc knuckle